MAKLPRSILTAMICGLVLIFLPTAALAHDALKSSSPGKNAKVKSLEEIELEFTARIRMPVVVLRDSGDKLVPLSKPVADGKTVTTEVPEALAAGRYVIGWRVVSSDGHPIQGEIPFTVTAPPTPSSDPTPTDTVSPAEATSAAPAPPVESASTQPADPGRAAAATQEGQGLPGWIWVVAAVLVALGAGMWFAGSRRRTAPAGPTPGKPAEAAPASGKPTDDGPSSGEPAEDGPGAGNPTDDGPVSGKPADDGPAPGKVADDGPEPGGPAR
ncbi:copper resistance protein CopC [Nonomuraea sp. NPDC059007]|uniref:copper resistance CopC family protein n=1 Tax=Nonomuraea sp. NPDC059007 TaxID=3346692 RepID=UPI0036B6956B